MSGTIPKATRREDKRGRVANSTAIREAIRETHRIRRIRTISMLMFRSRRRMMKARWETTENRLIWVERRAAPLAEEPAVVLAVALVVRVVEPVAAQVEKPEEGLEAALAEEQVEELAAARVEGLVVVQ